ncbi:hypothetical protein BX600DRAFT_24068 [Xylariales sp. PMI_506]|nr:hypothetical protein BX600DRAFT_24068 [Xylariales sp. PMI_506]
MHGGFVVSQRLTQVTEPSTSLEPAASRGTFVTPDDDFGITQLVNSVFIGVGQHGFNGTRGRDKYRLPPKQPVPPFASVQNPLPEENASYSGSVDRRCGAMFAISAMVECATRTRRGDLQRHPSPTSFRMYGKSLNSYQLEQPPGTNSNEPTLGTEGGCRWIHVHWQSPRSVAVSGTTTHVSQADLGIF